ncbi:MAG: IS4 family transposase [Proteobacteria bacterium]|nr:IS4 family transposase [Pseudomonadota bacterium]
MHATKMLHQTIKKSCPQIHHNRLTALVDVVESLVYGKTLTITGLGRASLRDTSMKHSIKQSDRLIGNGHLHEERTSIYHTVTQQLIGNNKRPLILIDWSDYTDDRSQLLLRASVPVGGRALTLYEEVHPLKAYGNARIQKRFLKTLHSFLSTDCCPSIITDAGFMSPWFRSVQKLGWNYIGRIRRDIYYRETLEQDWTSCSTLHDKATSTPRCYGNVEIVRYHPFRCHLYVYKQPSKGRHKVTKHGEKAQSRHSKKNARREDSPWLLVSSLGQDDISAKQVIQLYSTRMQIEEGFRDIKNHRTGFSLSDTRTRSPQRLANLLLVGMLATLVVWLMGRLAEEKQWHYQFQANTVKTHRVLSLFYLGCLLVVQGQFNFTQHELKLAIKLVQMDILRQWEN